MNQICQSTTKIPDENVFAFDIQPIPNERLTNASCRRHICHRKPSSNAISKFCLPGPLTVSYSPFFTNIPKTNKCYFLPAMRNTLLNPQTLKPPPLMSPQSSLFRPPLFYLIHKISAPGSVKSRPLAYLNIPFLATRSPTTTLQNSLTCFFPRSAYHQPGAFSGGTGTH